MNTTHLLLVLLALVAANLPWFSERLFYVAPLKRKHFGWHLLELAALYFVVGGLAWLVERSRMGQVAPQNWEFFVITVCLFLVFAFPGFVYRYLWKK